MSDTAFKPGRVDRSTPVYVTGHRGLAGSAIWRKLRAEGFTNLIGCSSDELDLRDRRATFRFVRDTRPEVIVMAAAKVGGILANDSHPVDFLSDNIRMQVNTMDAALECRVPRLLFMGSSCIYPRDAKQPIDESALLAGPLEPTNAAYAIAKISGIVHVQAVRRQYGLPWISAMPTNLYGPQDNFTDESSHVLPALIRRYEAARREGTAVVTNWGSGRPRREFLHVDDMASAILCLLEEFDGYQQINVGTGVDHTIAEVATMVGRAVGFTGRTRWDTSKPDGTPRKLLDVTALCNLGWRYRIPLSDGIAQTVDWYRTNSDPARAQPHRTMAGASRS